MRKVLLATAAFVVLGTGTALAAGSNPTTISATVLQNCTITDPADIDLSSSATGSSGFDFTCNFGGSGTPLPLNIGFQSANGGLVNPDDATTRGYDITYNSVTFAASTSLVLQADTSSGAGNTNSRTFDVTRVALPIAGLYSDVLTVSVAP